MEMPDKYCVKVNKWKISDEIMVPSDFYVQVFVFVYIEIRHCMYDIINSL